MPFAKNDDVIRKRGELPPVRYKVLTRHRDGSLTVKAMFFLNEDGSNRSGYLGYVYPRQDASEFEPLVNPIAASVS